MKKEERYQAEDSHHSRIQWHRIGPFHTGLLSDGGPQIVQNFSYLYILANRGINVHWLHSSLNLLVKLFSHF